MRGLAWSGRGLVVGCPFPRLQGWRFDEGVVVGIGAHVKPRREMHEVSGCWSVETGFKREMVRCCG
ncbi:MAG: hypothetical protein ACKPHU_29835 [Planctomycetaceae bacterium]